jgi:hypothetical protein
MSGNQNKNIGIFLPCRASLLSYAALAGIFWIAAKEDEGQRY